MDTLTYKGQEFHNWCDYFRWLFSKNGLFEPPEITRKSQAVGEKFRFKDKNNETEIFVEYNDNYTRLIYYYILHPLTIGYTAFQEKGIQYFEQGQFDDPPEYGGPGLNFDLTNLKGIDEELAEGLKGKEVQYLKENQVIISKIQLDNDLPIVTFRFDNKGLLSRLKDKLTGVNEANELKERTIDLKDIFGGIE